MKDNTGLNINDWKNHTKPDKPEDAYGKFQYLEWMPKLCKQKTDSPEKCS